MNYCPECLTELSSELVIEMEDGSIIYQCPLCGHPVAVDEVVNFDEVERKLNIDGVVLLSLNEDDCDYCDGCEDPCGSCGRYC